MIEFRDVKLAFEGKIIFQNLSLKIERGEKVVILGKSGSGKTSLIGLLLGFTTPLAGQVLFDGDLIDGDSVWNVRRRVAYVDQDGSIGSGQVMETIKGIFSLKNNAQMQISDQEIYALMNQFDLERDTAQSQVGELSGGERQRVAIVISLLLNRDVYLLDEVTSALDQSLKEKVAEYFLNQDELTAMIVSHDPVWMEYPSVKAFDLEVNEWIR